MKRPLLATAALAAVGCSLLLAGPAHAATPTPEPSSTSSATPRFDSEYDPTFKNVTYDDAKHEATVTTANNYVGTGFRVTHWGGSSTVLLEHPTIKVAHDGDDWSYTYRDVYKGDFFALRSGLQPAIATYTITEGTARPQATVDTVVDGDIVHVTYTHHISGWTTIYDADHKKVAFTARSVKKPNGAYVTSLTLPNTGRTSTYTAEINTTAGEDWVKFTINDGMTDATPAAPTVGAVDPAGTRALATVTGEAGATVTVKDAADKTVAVKILGTSGTTQVIVPASTIRTANAFTVTQTAGGATSAATSFTA